MYAFCFWLTIYSLFFKESLAYTPAVLTIVPYPIHPESCQSCLMVHALFLASILGHDFLDERTRLPDGHVNSVHIGLDRKS